MSYGLMRPRYIYLVQMVSSVCGGNQVRSTKTSVSWLQSSMVVGVSWSGAAWVLGSYSSLREPWIPTCTVTYWSRAWSPPFGDWAAGGPILIFSLRGVLTFVASGLDMNGCVLSHFEGTANLHCYTSCTLTTLHCSKVSFLQCCHMKRYNKIFAREVRLYIWWYISNGWNKKSIVSYYVLSFISWCRKIHCLR